MVKYMKYGLALSTVTVFIGCGGGGTPTQNPNTAIGKRLTGQVKLGNVSGADISLFDLSGHSYGTVSTKADGTFILDVNLSKKGLYRFKSEGGHYDSEADGKEKEAGELCALFTLDPEKGDRTGILISALSTYACAYVDESGSLTEEKLAEAYEKLSEIFGLEDGTFYTKFPELTKAGLTSGDIEARLALLFGMFEEMAIRLGLDPLALYRALAADFSDGKFDGKKSDGSSAGGSTTPYADFMAALDAYKSGGTEIKDAGLLDDVSGSAAFTGIASGLVKFAPASSGLSATSSGAVATLSYESNQYVYIAARDKKLVGYKITDPAHPERINLDLLNTAIDSELSSLGGVVSVPGKAKPIVMVYAYSNKKVLFIDMSTKEIIGSTELDISKQQGFSGGIAYISSGIADAIHGGVWLATADGYWFVDTTTMEAADEPIALVNDQIISENIGADVSSDLLFSPNYGPGYGGGLQLVNTDTGKAYSLENDAWESVIGTLPGMYYADAGAVDTGLHIGIVSPEDANILAFVNLSDMSKYSINEAESTFTAADGNISKLVSSFDMLGAAGGSWLQFSNAAVDSTTHLMLLSAGYSTAIGVAKLEAAPSTGEWNPVSKRAYYIATSGEYSYAADPHASGVVNSIGNHKSYGYILSADGYVLQIDMQAFLDADVKDAAGIESDAFALETTPFSADGSIKRLAIE